MIVFAAIAPHPPESIPEIGTPFEMAKIEKTLLAFAELRKGLEEARPDTIIIISPHANLQPYHFVINSSPELVGSFDNFGLKQSYKFKNDIAIADELAHACHIDKLRVRLKHDTLDYGALIPLYHLTKNIKPKIVHLAFSLMSYKQHYRYGQILKQIVDNDEFLGNTRIIGANDMKRVAIIASADLSHRLMTSAPAGYSPMGEIFDHELMHHLHDGNLQSLFDMRKEVIDGAAECGLRSIFILLGALQGKEHAFKLLSYEGPFGVGHMVARLV